MSADPTAPRAADAHYRRTLDCVHCGLCLPACPTYELFGREATGPRGRVYLMRGLAEGEIAPTPEVVRDLDLCLVCRACEPVCPSGVRFGELMEHVRSEVLEPARTPAMQDRVRRAALRHLLPFPRRVRLLAHVLRLCELVGLRRLLRRAPARSGLALRERLLPPIPPRRARRPLPRRTPSAPGHRGRVALLEGCVMPVLLGDTNRATAAVLAQQGFEVATPRPTCCGALSAHFGAQDAARAAARRAMDAFGRLGAVDAIVVNSAGCGAALKEYPRLLEGDPRVGPRELQAARAFSARVRDVSEFLVERGLRPPGGRLEVRVAYADACHLAHGQGVRAQPRQLLTAIPGVELVELARPDRCCGAAGLYNALHPRESLRLLEDRIADLKTTGATILATANPGCLLQWRAGVAAAGLRIEVVHPVELFARATKAL